MKKSKMLLYRKLFTSVFSVSAFTFGGGYVIIPLMHKKFVKELAWIEEQEMLDLIAIGQSAPGPIVINTSILIGYRLAGAAGAFASVFGAVLPPLVILTIVSLFYTAFRDSALVSALMKGMQAGVCAVIVDVAITLANSVVCQKDILSLLIMAGAFVASFFLKVNIAFILLSCIFIGVLSNRYTHKRIKGRS